MIAVRVLPFLAVALLGAKCATLSDHGDGGQRTVVGTARAPTDIPIVLVHGMAGFGNIGGVAYFYKVAETLAADGRTVFTTEVDPFNTVAHRAAQLAPQLDAILDHTGAAQVDLIAHSQGGLDARYLIAHLGFGDRVRTLVTVATPHHGTLVADAALGWVPTAPAGAAAAFNLLDWFGRETAGADVDLQAQVWGMSRRYVEETFNPATPDDPRVRYYSYAGSTQASPFVDRQTTDVVLSALLGSYLLLKALEGDNDGMVSVTSAAWGTFLGVLPADHADQIGQPLGATSKAFDYLVFYRALARFLAGEASAPVY